MAILESLKPLIGLWPIGGLLYMSAIGCLPRIGPERAITVAAKSFLFPRKPIESLRPKEVDIIRQYVQDKPFKFRLYLVVTGQDGIGKTTLINYALKRTPGVVKIHVRSGQTEESMVKEALNAFLRCAITPLAGVSVPLVNFWFRVFTLGRRPIILIRVDNMYGKE